MENDPEAKLDGYLDEITRAWTLIMVAAARRFKPASEMWKFPFPRVAKGEFEPLGTEKEAYQHPVGY